MNLILPGLFLLLSSAAYAQTGTGSAVEEHRPVYVMLAPAGSDTGLDKRCQMLIHITHISEGRFMGYRYKDQAFLLACDDDNAADIVAKKISAVYKDATVKKLGYLKSYINVGFNDVEKVTIDPDATFPSLYNTEDQMLSNLSYEIEKKKWMAEHPDSEWAKANAPQK